MAHDLALELQLTAGADDIRRRLCARGELDPTPAANPLHGGAQRMPNVEAYAGDWAMMAS